MNRSSSFYLAVLSVTTMLSGASPSYADAAKIGVVAAADQTVTIISHTGEKRIVKLGDPIFAQDRVTTNAQGKAQLLFEDRSTITINESAELVIDKFVYDPNAQKGAMSVAGVKGAFRFIGGALSKNNPVEVRTPVATIGIRGGIADTTIQPDGQTQAVFHFGNEMTMENQNGQVTRITESGAGVSLATGDALPQTMTPIQVQQTMNAVSSSWNGGGVSTPPTEQSVAPAVNNINSQQQAPVTEQPAASDASSSSSSSSTSGTTTSATQNASSEETQNTSSADSGTVASSTSASASGETQAPAPVVIVQDASAPVMDIPIAGINRPIGVQERQVALQQSASENPEILRKFVPQDALAQIPQVRDTTATTITPSDSRVTSDAPVSRRGRVSAAIEQAAVAPPEVRPVADSAPSVGTTPPIITPPNNTANPPVDPVTAEPSLSGGYLRRKADAAGGILRVYDKGEIKNVTSTATSYSITLDSNGTLPDRTIILPKLTQTGYNAPQSRTVGSDATAETRTVRGYKSRGGAFSHYEITKDGADTIDDKKLHLGMGTDIFSHGAADGVTAYSQAANASKNAAMGANAVHGVDTNGIVMYDFLAPVDLGPIVSTGISNYGMQSDFGASVNQYDAKFGMAIDWKGNTAGQEGKMVSGAMQWKTGGTRAYAIGGHARRVGAADPNNQYLMTGRQLTYAPPAGGVGSFNTFSAWGIDDMYNTQNGMVEALTMDSATPGSGGPSAIDNANVVLNATGSTIANRQKHIAVVKEGSVAGNQGLTRQMQANRTTEQQKGFAAGVMMRHDGTNYLPQTVASTHLNQVSITNDAASMEHKKGSLRVVRAESQSYDMTDYMQAEFKEANGMGAYVNDKTYVMQQTQANNSGLTTNVSNGMIMSGEFATDARTSIPTDYHCTDCQFVNWGVWAGEAGSTSAGTSQNQAAMIPYVVGQVTQTNQLPTTGTATYKGEAYATVLPASNLPKNITGTMQATATLNGTSTQINNFHLNFGTVEGASLAMEGYNAMGAPIPLQGGADATFVAALKDASNTQVGNMNGAFFGPQGQEMGGNYVFNRPTDNLKGAGVFMGKQRP